MSVNIPIKGMVLDRVPTDVKNTEYTYALNAVFEDFSGNELRLTNEHGNELFETLEGRTINGSINLTRDQIVIFSYDDSYSYIGVIESGSYSDYIKSSCLSFSNRIRGEYKIKNGCERIIIFNEVDNPDRLINLDRLDLYVTGGVTVEEANSTDSWDCNEMRLQPFAIEPIIDLERVLNSGGNLPVGTIAFQIEYVDQNSNIIYKSSVSPTVNIYDENVGAAYDEIDGAYNIEVFQAEDGGVPNTSKAVQLRISNLDTRFPFFRLTAIQYKQADGLTPFVHTVANRFLTSEADKLITYTGFNPDAGDFQVDTASLNIKPVIYDSSFTLTQVDNRLVRANLVEEFRDYSSYQRTVNAITMKPVVKQIAANDQTEDGNAKNPNTYWDTRGLMGDEIYAPAIEFIFSSGKTSPAFHIPARAKIAGVDDTIITYSPTNENLKHLPVKDTYEWWEVFNTGTVDRFGYYEAETNYPLTKDCDGEYIYGELAGTPIRYPRVPCRREIPLTEGGLTGFAIPPNIINIIGIEFDNIEYPDDDIIGHRFLIVKRNSNTKTVLDNGYLFGPERIEDDQYKFEQMTRGIDTSSKAVAYLSPNSLLNRYQNGNYFKLNRIHTRLELDNFFPEEHGRREYGDANSSREFEIRSYWADYSPQGNNTISEYRSYDANVFVDRNSLLRTSQFDNDVRNLGYNHPLNIYELVNPVSESIPNGAMVYATNKRYIRPYENLEALEYVAMHPGYYTNTDSPQQVFGGDTFVSEMRIVNLSQVFVGAREGFVDLDRDYEVVAEYLVGLYVESEINFDLVHSGTGDQDRFRGTEPPLHPYVITQVATQRDDGDWDFRGFEGVLEQVYLYNDDYSVVQGGTPNFSLSNTFNYCNKCRNLYPNRIIWSIQDFDDLDTEGYKIFKPEDATTVGANTGAITMVHYDKNRMLVRTKQSMYQMAPNPQEIQTDIESTYIGTGDFLSIPPREMVKTSYGYAGGTGRFDYVSTEYGLITVDSDAGQIFLFSGNSVKELSSHEYGVHRWMNKNLPNNVDYINCVFDPAYSRLLVFKKGTEKRYSWTLSFSFDQNGWTSFHSYLPDYAFSDINNLYMVQDDEIHKSDILRLNTYFGIQYDYVVEYVVNAKGQTVDMDCLHYYAQTLQWDNDNQVWVDVDNPTFDRMLIYTDQQSTGLQELTFLDKRNNPWGNRVGWSNTAKDVVHAEQNYRIAAIKDLADNTPVITADWDKIEDKFPIDKVSNDENINYGRSQWELINMKDKYFRVRLYFNPATPKETKIILNITQSILTQSEL